MVLYTSGWDLRTQNQSYSSLTFFVCIEKVVRTVKCHFHQGCPGLHEQVRKIIRVIREDFMNKKKGNEGLSLTPLCIIEVSQGKTGTLSCMSGISRQPSSNPGCFLMLYLGMQYFKKPNLRNTASDAEYKIVANPNLFIQNCCTRQKSMQGM